MIKQEVLVAEDHALLRQGLCALLSNASELNIVGEAEDGRDAIEQARTLNPDVILMDLSMPNINGTEAILTIKRRNPKVKIIALTVHKSEEYVRAALDAGADGYVLKDDTRQDLLAAITNVQKGNVYLSPGICDKVLNGFLDKSPGKQGGRSWDLLTQREREVIKLIAEGNKNREIAEFL